MHTHVHCFFAVSSLLQFTTLTWCVNKIQSIVDKHTLAHTNLPAYAEEFLRGVVCDHVHVDDVRSGINVLAILEEHQHSISLFACWKLIKVDLESVQTGLVHESLLLDLINSRRVRYGQFARQIHTSCGSGSLGPQRVVLVRKECHGAPAFVIRQLACKVHRAYIQLTIIHI